MNQRFIVTRFDNKNGAISWRVEGRLGGLRVRRNFKTREEAAAERAALELRADQIESGFHSVMTSLSPEQLRDAEAAFCRLVGHSTSLAFCVDFALANYRPPEQEKPLDKAVEEYVAFKRREHERGIISAIQVNSIKKELVLLVGYFPDSVVAPLTWKQLTAFCERGAPSLKTYNNRRGILGTFFKFAFQQGWASANPIDRVPYHRIAHRRGSAKTLSAEQAAELMQFAVLREYQVASILLTQNLAVLDEKLGETAREGLCGLMGTKIFGPQGHAATRQWAADQIGKRKVPVETKSSGSSGGVSNHSKSEHQVWDYRVPPSRFAELKVGQTVCLRDSEAWLSRWHRDRPGNRGTVRVVD